MGIDWYTKHVALEYEWKGLVEGPTLWKCYEKGTLPEGIKSFDHDEHPSGAEIVLIENSVTYDKLETKEEWPQEDIDQWNKDAMSYSYLSFRASSYPALGEKTNLIMEYFLSAKDYELEEFVAKSMRDSPDAAEASVDGVNFFKEVLGGICQGALGDLKNIQTGGSIEPTDDLGSKISGALYFRDLAWQECEVVAKIFKRVSEYCKGKSETSPDENNFFGYYTKYFKRASGFMNACFVSEANVVSSY